MFVKNVRKPQAAGGGGVESHCIDLLLVSINLSDYIRIGISPIATLDCMQFSHKSCFYRPRAGPLGGLTCLGRLAIASIRVTSAAISDSPLQHYEHDGLAIRLISPTDARQSNVHINFFIGPHIRCQSETS